MIHARRSVPRWPLLGGLAVLAALFTPTRAVAQASDYVDRGRLVSAGMLLPPTSAATINEPWALSLNPAGLLFGPTGLAYIHEDGTTAEVDARRSDGLFFRLGGLSAGDTFGVAGGLSVEYIRPAGGGCPEVFPCIRRTTLGLALGTPALSFGVDYHWYSSGESVAIDNIGTWDVGTTWRPAKWLSTAFTIQALNSPKLGGDSIGRVFTLAAAVRPVGPLLTLAADFIVDDRAGWRGSRLAYLAGLALPHGFDLYAQFAHEVESPPEGRHLAMQIGLQGNFGVGAVSLSGAGTVVNGNGGFGGTVALEVWRGRGKSVLPPQSSAQILKLDEELAGPGTFEELLGMGGGLDAYTKLDLRMEQLAVDDSLDTLVIEIRGLDGLSLGRVEELRARIKALRAAGKKVLVWLQSGGDTEYYLATAADRIFAAPQGMLQINGFSIQHFFIRGLLDTLGIRPEFVKIGAYKSAPETFTDTQSSEPAAEQTNSMLDDEFGRYLAAIAESRHLTIAQVQEKLAQGLYVSEEAVKAGLIDGVSAAGEALEEPVSKLAGRDIALQKLDQRKHLANQWGDVPEIAIVEVIGDIVSGKTNLFGKAAASEPIVRALREAAEDPKVKAIVLRIDSPGGDVGASELIYQAVVEARKSKPVIASFGDVAASGGYYVASGAGTIFAEPSTVTGSIGVFAGKADISQLLSHLGITNEEFKRGAHADLFSLTRPWTPQERQIIEGMVSTFYEAFVKRVAEGRKMSVDQVKAIAQGRVWTGAQAKERGLVDTLGGLKDALVEARRQAGVPANARIVVSGAKGLFDLPDASATVAAIRGRDEQRAPGMLMDLHALFGGTAEAKSLEEAWPLLQALKEGRPLALALDVPVVR